jgi:hypothetical protein
MTSAEGVRAARLCANKNMDRDRDSKIMSSSLSAQHPSVVIHLNTLFTNFGPEIAMLQAVYLQSREAMT